MILALAAICAETSAEAEQLGSSVELSWVRLLSTWTETTAAFSSGDFFAGRRKLKTESAETIPGGYRRERNQARLHRRISYSPDG